MIMTVLYLTAAVWRLRLKETMTDGAPIRFSYFFSSYPKAVKESFAVWRTVPRTVFWIFSMRTLVMFGMSLSNVINALYAREILGIPEEQWWLVFIPLLLTMIVASLPIGKFVDKVGRKIPIILGLLVLSVGTILFIFGNFVTVMVAMSLYGFAQMLIMSGALALSTDLTEPVNRGKVVGFNNFFGYIIMGIGMLLGGYLYENFMPQSPFIISLGTVFAALLVVLFLVNERRA